MLELCASFHQHFCTRHERFIHNRGRRWSESGETILVLGESGGKKYDGDLTVRLQETRGFRRGQVWFLLERCTLAGEV
jgi:hypothetical protein